MKKLAVLIVVVFVLWLGFKIHGMFQPLPNQLAMIELYEQTIMTTVEPNYKAPVTYTESAVRAVRAVHGVQVIPNPNVSQRGLRERVITATLRAFAEADKDPTREKGMFSRRYSPVEKQRAAEQAAYALVP